MNNIEKLKLMQEALERHQDNNLESNIMNDQIINKLNVDYLLQTSICKNKETIELRYHLIDKKDKVALK